MVDASDAAFLAGCALVVSLATGGLMVAVLVATHRTEARVALEARKLARAMERIAVGRRAPAEAARAVQEPRRAHSAPPAPSPPGMPAASAPEPPRWARIDEYGELLDP